MKVLPRRCLTRTEVSTWHSWALLDESETIKALQEARRVARQLVGILEWPYLEGLFGPPLAHRLNPDDWLAFPKGGVSKVEAHELSNTVFIGL